MAVSTANPVFAGSTSVTNGKSARVKLGFRIEIPTSLVLMVKTTTADNIPISRSITENSETDQFNVKDKNIYVTASANVTKHGVLNASPDLLSGNNSPTSIERAGQGHIESFPLPYKTTGWYRLAYQSIDSVSVISPYDSATFILCSP